MIGYNEGKIPYHNATSYDYNASLGGQMEKYWDLDQPDSYPSIEEGWSRIVDDNGSSRG